MTFGKRATLVAATGLFAALATAGAAQAEPTAAACDNAAFAPYLTPGPNGWLVNGDVRREGDTCGNASVVANVYKDTGWWDELAASFERTFATGPITATGDCLGSGDYYTQIRLDGETVAESDPVRLDC